jgi:hypothetical protein
MPYTREHFLSVSPGSIDYSPYQPAPVVTLILEESELRHASYSQFERFWRVWYTERSSYAPALQTLVLGLSGATSRCDDSPFAHKNGEQIALSTGQSPAERDDDGLARFIAYFHTDVYPYAEKVGLDVYDLDASSAEPKRLFRILPAAQTLPAPHTLTSMALHRNG